MKDILFKMVLFFSIALMFWSQNTTEQKLIDLSNNIKLYHKGTKNELQQLKRHLNNGGHTRHTNQSIPTISDKNNLLTADPFYRDIFEQLVDENVFDQGSTESRISHKPDHFHPLTNTASVSQLNALCLPSLATTHIGHYERFAPELAHSITRIDVPGLSTSYVVTLRDDIFWEPIEPSHFPSTFQLSDMFLERVPVEAKDFNIYYDACMNKHVTNSGAKSSKTYLRDIFDFTIINPTQFIVSWKADPNTGQSKYTSFQQTAYLKPLPHHVFTKYADGNNIITTDDYQSNSAWAQAIKEHWSQQTIVSCGPWMLKEKNDSLLVFEKNTTYPHQKQAINEKKRIHVVDDDGSAWKQFQDNQFDSHVLKSEQRDSFSTFINSDAYKNQKENGSSIHKLNYLAHGYSLIAWNLSAPQFSSKFTRQAIAHAVNMNELIDTQTDNQAIQVTGPFHYASTSYNHDVQPYAHDIETAIQLLEKDGWILRNGSDIREKNIDGVWTPFKFKLMVFNQPTSKRLCTSIKHYLEKVNIDVTLHTVDQQEWSDALNNKTFDAILMGWALGSPPEDPRQLWHSSQALLNGSSNITGFNSSEADRIIGSLTYETNPNKRKELYDRFHELIYDESPYLFLYTRKTEFIYRDYLKNIYIPKHHPSIFTEAVSEIPPSEIRYSTKS